MYATWTKKETACLWDVTVEEMDRAKRTRAFTARVIAPRSTANRLEKSARTKKTATKTK